MPRQQKLYHYIYKTTCQVTGKFYVGMHSTDNLEDGYLGSGKILGYSRKKYGDENHKKEIIEMCPTREALKLREKEIVNEQLLADPLNINLKYGGDGGGKIWNEEHRLKFVSSTRTQVLRGTDKARQISQKAGETRRKNGTTARGNTSMSVFHIGTKWMHNGTIARKVPKEQIQAYLDQGFKFGMPKQNASR